MTQRNPQRWLSAVVREDLQPRHTDKEPLSSPYIVAFVDKTAVARGSITTPIGTVHIPEGYSLPDTLQ